MDTMRDDEFMLPKPATLVALEIIYRGMCVELTPEKFADCGTLRKGGMRLEKLIGLGRSQT